MYFQKMKIFRLLLKRWGIRKKTSMRKIGKIDFSAKPIILHDHERLESKLNAF